MCVISRREFTDVTGRPVQVLFLGAFDAGIRRAWVRSTLAQALAPAEPPDLSSGAACALPDTTPALAA